MCCIKLLASYLYLWHHVMTGGRYAVCRVGAIYGIGFGLCTCFLRHDFLGMFKVHRGELSAEELMECMEL